MTRTQVVHGKQAQGPPPASLPSFPAIPPSLVLSFSLAEAFRKPSNFLGSAKRDALYGALGITQIPTTAMPAALAELKALNGRVSIGAGS